MTHAEELTLLAAVALGPRGANSAGIRRAIRDAVGPSQGVCAKSVYNALERLEARGWLERLPRSAGWDERPLYSVAPHAVLALTLADRARLRLRQTALELPDDEMPGAPLT